MWRGDVPYDNNEELKTAMEQIQAYPNKRMTR